MVYWTSSQLKTFARQQVREDALRAEGSHSQTVHGPGGDSRNQRPAEATQPESGQRTWLAGISLERRWRGQRSSWTERTSSVTRERGSEARESRLRADRDASASAAAVADATRRRRCPRGREARAAEQALGRGICQRPARRSAPHRTPGACAPGRGARGHENLRRRRGSYAAVPSSLSVPAQAGKWPAACTEHAAGLPGPGRRLHAEQRTSGHVTRMAARDDDTWELRVSQARHLHPRIHVTFPTRRNPGRKQRMVAGGGTGHQGHTRRSLVLMGEFWVLVMMM